MPVEIRIEVDSPNELAGYLAAMVAAMGVTVGVKATPIAAVPVAANDNEQQTEQEEVDPPKKPRRARARKVDVVEATAETKTEEAKDPEAKTEDAPESDIDIATLRKRAIALAAHAQDLDPDNASARQDLVKELLVPFDVSGIGKLEKADYAAFNDAITKKGADLVMEWDSE